MPGPAAIQVVPAGPDQWEAVELLLGGDGERGCWCQAWRGRDAQAKATGETRPETLRRQLRASPPPGFVARLDGEPVGWVGVSVRPRTPRLLRSRTIPMVDDQPVWAIGCFVVRVGYRRMGVARALLDGVVKAAREAGAPGVEAYPIDPQGRRVSVTQAYVGVASMFDAAGFHRVVVTEARSAGLPRVLVRLELAAAG